MLPRVSAARALIGRLVPITGIESVSHRVGDETSRR